MSQPSRAVTSLRWTCRQATRRILHSVSDIGDENKLQSPVAAANCSSSSTFAVGLPPWWVNLAEIPCPFIPPLLWWTSIQLSFRTRVITLLWTHCTKKLSLTPYLLRMRSHYRTLTPSFSSLLVQFSSFGTVSGITVVLGEFTFLPFQHDENKFIHSLNDLLPLGFQESYSFLAGIMCRYAVLANMRWFGNLRGGLDKETHDFSDFLLQMSLQCSFAHRHLLPVAHSFLFLYCWSCGIC